MARARSPAGPSRAVLGSPPLSRCPRGDNSDVGRFKRGLVVTETLFAQLGVKTDTTGQTGGRTEVYRMVQTRTLCDPATFTNLGFTAETRGLTEGRYGRRLVPSTSNASCASADLEFYRVQGLRAHRWTTSNIYTIPVNANSPNGAQRRPRRAQGFEQILSKHWTHHCDITC